jgi:hypothetical protein
MIRFVLLAAKLIAPVIQSSSRERQGADDMTGYDWVIEHCKAPRLSPRGSSNSQSVSVFAKLAMELQIAKGIAYLKKKQFESV